MAVFDATHCCFMHDGLEMRSIDCNKTTGSKVQSTETPSQQKQAERGAEVGRVSFYSVKVSSSTAPYLIVSGCKALASWWMTRTCNVSSSRKNVPVRNACKYNTTLPVRKSARKYTMTQHNRQARQNKRCGKLKLQARQNAEYRRTADKSRKVNIKWLF